MQRLKDGTSELDVDDICSLEDAIVCRVRYLGTTDKPEAIAEIERLKRIYQRMMCAGVFIK